MLILLGFATVASGVAVYTETGGDWMEEVHEMPSDTMLGMVVFHILGVIVSSWAHHENLVLSMCNGYKRGKSAEAIVPRKRYWMIVLIVSVILVSLLVCSI